MRSASPRSRLRFTVIALASTLLALTAFLIRAGGSRHEKSFLSAKDARNIEKIVIAEEGDVFEIVLRPGDGDVWALAVDDGHSFPVRQGKAGEFISALTKRRTVILAGKSGQAAYGIGIAGSRSVTVFGDSGKTTTLHFGNSDQTGRWIYFTSDETPGSIYRTEAGIASFLDIRASGWAELAVFKKRLEKTDIQEITARTGALARTYRAGRDAETAAFEEALAALVCADITNGELPPTESVTVTYGDSSTDSISFAPAGDFWIMKDSRTGCPYVITAEMKQRLFSALERRES